MLKGILTSRQPAELITESSSAKAEGHVAPVRQTQGHGAEVARGQPCDQPLHLIPNAPHQLGHSGAVHTAQVQLFLSGKNSILPQKSQQTASNESTYSQNQWFRPKIVVPYSWRSSNLQSLVATLIENPVLEPA